MRILSIVVLFLFTCPTYANTQNEVLHNCHIQRTDKIDCMACNIYHEARSEAIAGQLAVALVTLNRMNSKLYPNKVCRVVYELRRSAKTKRLVPMFSWTKDGKHDKVYNKRKWKLAIALSKKVLGPDKVYDFTFGSLWYHRIDITPFWMAHYHPTVRIGLHQFYSDKEATYLKNLLSKNYSTTEIHDLTKLTLKK